MTIGSTVQAVANGDNLTTHVATVSAIGGAMATVSCWVLQLNHIDTPPAVVAAFGVLYAAMVSFAAQKFSA